MSVRQQVPDSPCPWLGAAWGRARLRISGWKSNLSYLQLLPPRYPEVLPVFPAPLQLRSCCTATQHVSERCLISTALCEMPLSDFFFPGVNARGGCTSASHSFISAGFCPFSQRGSDSRLSSAACGIQTNFPVQSMTGIHSRLFFLFFFSGFLFFFFPSAGCSRALCRSFESGEALA